MKLPVIVPHVDENDEKKEKWQTTVCCALVGNILAIGFYQGKIYLNEMIIGL